jgi:hypothetical protein
MSLSYPPPLFYPGMLCRHLERLSSVLLECLPGFWQAAGPNKLTLPPNLPSAAAAQLQATMAGMGSRSRARGMTCWSLQL